MDSLKLLLSQNQRDRIIKEASAQNRSGDPNLPRHTIYQGDRKIQQLGQETIENGVILNNQSLAIGDVVMPLAKGNILRRVDNTNGGALLGTAYRDAVENDIDANGNRRDSALSRNGGNEPSTPVNPISINPSTHPILPPPFGCTPPPPKCFWTTNPTPPDGFQSHGSAVVNENAVPLYLHCTIGSAVPKNLNCDFLSRTRWKCVGGVCVEDPNGIYATKAECEAALVPPLFTGGQCAGTLYTIVWRWRQFVTADGTLIYDSQASFYPTGITSSAYGKLDNYQVINGQVVAGSPNPQNGFFLGYNISSSPMFHTGVSGSFRYGTGITNEITIHSISGTPDNCGDLPSTCPP